MEGKCPGQDKRSLKIELVRCSQCGYQGEMFSDEMSIKCPQCKSLICRKKAPTCLDWCKSARECRGDKEQQKGRSK